MTKTEKQLARKRITAVLEQMTKQTGLEVGSPDWWVAAVDALARALDDAGIEIGGKS